MVEPVEDPTVGDRPTDHGTLPAWTTDATGKCADYSRVGEENLTPNQKLES